MPEEKRLKKLMGRGGERKPDTTTTTEYDALFEAMGR